MNKSYYDRDFWLGVVVIVLAIIGIVTIFNWVRSLIDK